MKKRLTSKNSSLSVNASQHPRWLFAAGTLFLTCMLCFFGPGADSAENNESQIEQTRTALQEWVEVRGKIAQEKRDLILAKQMLNERIELVEQEITSLRGKINDTEESIAEADKKRGEMLEENEKLKQSSVLLGANLITLEEGVKKLLVRLPEPIRDRVKPLSQRIPDDPEQTKLSVAQRFQNIVGILNEVDKFNRQISTFSEVRILPDSSAVEVASVYVGIGHGYYASANKSVAGVGKATQQGWIWKPANESAEQISDVIQILKNEKVASFVQVPVEIQ